MPIPTQEKTQRVGIMKSNFFNAIYSHYPKTLVNTLPVANGDFLTLGELVHVLTNLF
jgi:hypothetical protein